MKATIFENETEAALYAVEAAAGVLAEKPTAVFCLAAGHSSLPFFDALAAMNLNFSQARFVELDEWMDLPLDASGSCAGFLRRNFLSRVNFAEENICFFDPLATDGEAEALRVTGCIAGWGGIDDLLLGMGLNGHLGLNEPGCCLDGAAHVAPLAKTTLEVAPKYFGGAMPPLTRGITLGIADLKAARLIHLLVFGSHKQEICARLRSCSGPDPQLPASVLPGLDHAHLIIDRGAAGY
jgi:6-phosphogluconolactonase/glucosamine-6-phosphate isomerase/deaminase